MQKFISFLFLFIFSYGEELCIDNICIEGSDISSLKKVETTKLKLDGEVFYIKHNNMWIDSEKHYDVIGYSKSTIKLIVYYDGHPYLGLIFEIDIKDDKYNLSRLSTFNIGRDYVAYYQYKINSKRHKLNFIFDKNKKIGKDFSFEKYNDYDKDGNHFILWLPLKEKALILKNHKTKNLYDVSGIEIDLKENPLANKNLTTYNNIAYYLQKAGSNEEAIYLLEKILKKYPNRTVAYYNIGDAYWAFGEKKKAKEAYTTYIEQMCDAGKQKRIPKVVRDRVSNK